MIQAAIAGAVLAVVGALGLYAWDADRALKREHDRAEAATMQRDQLQKYVLQLTADIAERNRRAARFMALPEMRKRLCARRGAGDPCCTPTAECKP